MAGPAAIAIELTEDERVHEVVTRTLETKPRGATDWSTRTLAEELGLSQSTVSRIWRAFNLQPHRSETFKLSTDPRFVEKVRDVVGLYMDRDSKAIVLCVDEKSHVQALDRTQPILPMRPGSPERHTHEYVRHGTTSLFAALDIRTGVVIGACHRKNRHQEFIMFLNSVDEVVLHQRGIEIIPDMLCNAGGVTVSYFEWVQNRSNVTWDVEQVDRELNRIMCMAARRTIVARQKYEIDMRTAAYVSSLEHLGDVYTNRGIWP